MVQGYLLDTNTIAYWFSESRPEHRCVTEKVASRPVTSPLRVSAISLGEIEYGHKANPQEGRETQVLRDQFVREQLPIVLDVRKTTKMYYGELRAQLFERFAPRKGRKGLRPEQLVDPISSLALTIQENDLWIAAQAIEHNLVLVTSDHDMWRIQEVAPELMVEDWAKPEDR